MSYFNVRVYGILINDNREVLISDEISCGKKFSKFPGGGVEIGEGLIEALKREFIEECNLEIKVLQHIYTTDFFEKSSFNESQILSVYYLVENLQPIGLNVKTTVFDFDTESSQSFRWISLDQISPDDVTFRTDKIAVQYLLKLPQLS